MKYDFSAESWLRLAVWWLVKSRTISKLLAQTSSLRRRTEEPTHQNFWDNTISAEQAYADLLKSSWILEEIVLAGTIDGDLTYTHIRRIIKDLANSLDRDLLERRGENSDLPAFDSSIVFKHNLLLLEDFEQAIEAKENVPKAMDDPASSHRWLEVDQDNAGYKYEKVMFRTFVNAQLGSKEGERSKSSNAPYMLLLWTKAGESDLLISLCNHPGTVNLSRNLVAEDLKRLENRDENMPISIDFPSQEAEVKFLDSKEVLDFFDVPRHFFAAMKERNPRPGELSIYQAPLSTYCDSRPQSDHTWQTDGSISSGKSSSCGIRVYESMAKRCWKATRRLVISSAPCSTNPVCVSHWLPLDHIRIIVEGPNVMITWSDCGQLKKVRDGNHGWTYSYNYKPEVPNRRIHLEFENDLEARRLEDCLLFPTEMPPHVSLRVDAPSSFQDARIYRLEDEAEPETQYHAVVLTKREPKGPHMTEIFYVYRDLDWVLKTKNDIPSVVEFSDLHTAFYVSTIPRSTYKLNDTDKTPEFSAVTEVLKSAHVELGCDHDLVKFMQGLTGWRLKFFRLAEKLVLTDTGHLIWNNKEVYKNVGIQLWEKASEEGRPRTQLAIRLDRQVKDRWMTASLFEVGHGSPHTALSFNVELQGLIIQHGIEIDSKEMTATNRGNQGQFSSKKRWKVTMVFQGIDGEWQDI